ncbi:MAG TPA: hypothetical protein DEG43_06805 [Acidimicrobiaceae bacterium]|nr:hypothetical protein [Acidimicrobiaceae bacterium]
MHLVNLWNGLWGAALLLLLIVWWRASSGLQTRAKILVVLLLLVPSLRVNGYFIPTSQLMLLFLLFKLSEQRRNVDGKERPGGET